MSEVRQLPSSPRSFNSTAVSSHNALPERLPIWVLSFWSRLSKAYHTCASWRSSLNWANALCAWQPANRQCVAELDSIIRQLPWHGYLTGKRRDRCVDDIFDLLSDGDLNSGQVNDLLEVLERRLAGTMDNRYLIAPTELSTLILCLYKNRMNSAYERRFTQQSAEEELTQRRRSAVASIAWIPVGGRGHWVSFIVDPIASTIFYANSLRQHIPSNLRDALQWWLCDLRRQMEEPETSPQFKQILVTPQYDGFSCGILSTNSLAHHFLPHTLPLVSSDAISVKRYRIECTLEILKLSIQPVCLFLPKSWHASLAHLGICQVPPSSPPTSPQPSSPLPHVPVLLPLTQSPPLLHGLPTSANLKHKRSKDNDHSPCKQQKISQFFTKLTQEEAAEQAVMRLVLSADAREEWVERQDIQNRKKVASRRAKNTHSQRGCRERKKSREVHGGVRGPDGKIKVSKSYV